MASPPSPPTSALYELTTKESKKVLRQVLEWGTPRKQEDKTFVEYLLQVKNISMSTFRKKFNQNQRKKMEKGNDSTAFDVSLLCVCIKYGCDGLASPEDDRWTNSGDTLEWYVTSIKNRRNAFLHEDYDINMNEFYRVTEELRDLFCNALKRAAEIYNVADGIVKDILGQLNEEINNIRDNPSQMPDGGSLIYDRLRQMVAIEGKRELKKAYRKVSGFGPVSNLLRGMEVRVDEIFTAMLVRQESTHGSTAQTEDIQFEDLLEAAERKRKDSRKDRVVLLVEGPAGAGKTTLTRKVISDWVKGTSSMRTLTDYDFVYLSRCRDGGIYSLSQLLASLMPTVRGKIQHEHSLLEYTWGNGSLFIVDGIDELNPASDRLLREIMKMGTENEITVLCTTRPNRVADFKKYVPDNFHLVHVKILGIEEKKRADFVTRYSEALPIENKDISGLLRYLARNDSRMQSHWRFPFNLVLVTILWLSDPNAVNHLTTATELFKKTHDFCVQKLLERLFDHEDTRILENTELEQKIKKFLKKFCKEAFISHCGDNMVLSNSSVQRLKEASRFLSLPSKEVLGAFLIQTTPLADVEEEYSFPHKSLQDFYSALHVIEILAVHETGLNIPSLISGIETLLLHEDVPKDVSSSLLSNCTNALKEYQLASTKGPLSIKSVLEKATKDASLFCDEKEEKMDLAKYQNIIIHLTGLVHLREKPLEEDRSTELVELLKSTGIRDTSQWLDLVSEVKCSAKVSELLAKAMDLTGVVEISDCHLTAFTRVLSHVQLGRLVLNITGDPEYVPCLRELLEAIEDKEWEVWLWLKHDFRRPRDKKTAIDDVFQQVLRSARLRLTWFQGWLSEAAALPSAMQDLRLAVTGDLHYRALLPALSSLPQRLGCLHLHVAARMDADSLRPLPDVRFLQLYVSGVEEATVESASRVVRALQPSRGKWGLLFPGVLECEEVFTRLVGHLARQGVQASGWGLIASPRLDEERERRLRNFVLRELGCEFRTWDEEDIWRSYY